MSKGKYWEGMDQPSWTDQLMGLFGGTTGVAANSGNTEEHAQDEEAAPSKSIAKKMLQRASTVSTVLDSEHFGVDTNQSVDLYHDGQEGWEVTLSKGRTRELIEKYTRHPHFVKRASICMSLIVFTIILISVLCATLSGRDTSIATSSANADDNIPTGGAGDNGMASGNFSDSDMASGNFSDSFDLDKPASPFSTAHPVDELQLFSVEHSRKPPSSLSRISENQATPTNAWYQNLLIGATEDEPSNIHKAYAVPYMVDVAGPIPGLRVHATYLDAQASLVKLLIVEAHGLTLGVSGTNVSDPAYSIQSTNQMGLTLEWNAFPMKSSIIRGMPFSTMHYPKPLSTQFLPTIASEIALQSPPIRDGNTTMECTAQPTRVESELKLTFSSDFTWLVFFSEPVTVQCIDNGTDVQWQVVDLANATTTRNDLTIRASLLSSCTSGLNAIYCTNENQDPVVTAEYEELLRERSHLYPGPNADVRYGVNTTIGKATVRLDWDVQDMKKSQQQNGVDESANELLMYALPHHLTRMQSEEWMPWNGHQFCVPSMIGSTCAVSGSKWDLEEDLPIASFRSPRPPQVEALPAIVNALQNDIHYVIPENFQRGAGDTYFSGKLLARVARVLLIHEELQDLCSGKGIGYVLNNEQKLAYMNACRDLELPSEEQIAKTMDMFQSSVEVWINGTSEAQFAYDSAWGGVINCGCLYDEGTQGCSNTLPACPATTDQGLNFGNGFYNDHHFHYGYHVYAAAALTHFDREWGRRHFEDVLVLVRDYANPSDDDVYFPTFRNKDWYQGSSWASGITLPTFGNIVNQESTSEAIAGYEAVALFGKEMMQAWKEVDEPAKVQVARNIRDAGLVTAATEIRSTDYYWHVLREDDPRGIYPSGYQHGVVGILWATMAQFTTWFGNAPYLIYGIQLLPLTPIAENRDANQEWLREMYQPLANSCAADSSCALHGWSVLPLAIMASIGHVDTAMEQAQSIPDQAFDSAGGNGHSMTNTLHYFATRPPVDEPADIIISNNTVQESSSESSLDCGIPQTCTSDVLSTYAAGYTCRERITWLMDVQGLNEVGACEQIGRAEYPDQCGPCVGSASNAATSSENGGNDRV